MGRLSHNTCAFIVLDARAFFWHVSAMTRVTASATVKYVNVINQVSLTSNHDRRDPWSKLSSNKPEFNIFHLTGINRLADRF